MDSQLFLFRGCFNESWNAMAIPGPGWPRLPRWCKRGTEMERERHWTSSEQHGILIIRRNMQLHLPCRIAESRDRWHQMTSDDILSFCILLHSFHFACWMAGPSKLTGQKLFCPWLSSPHILSPCSSSEHLQPLALHGWHLFPFRDAVRALILLSARKRRQSRWPPPWPWRWPPPWPWRRPWPALQLWWHDPGWLLETEHQRGHFWDYESVINISSCRVNAVTLQKYSKGKLDRVTLGWFFRFFKRQYTIISSNPHAITSATGGEKLRKRQCWHSTTKPAYSPARMYHEGQPDQSDILENPPVLLASRWKRNLKIQHFFVREDFQKVWDEDICTGA